MPGTIFAFDLRWSIELESLVDVSDDTTGADVRVGWSMEDDRGLSEASAELVWAGVVDDAIRLERDATGDYRFTYGDRAVFHVPASLDEVRCAPLDRRDAAWQRVLFDTVMLCVALLRGHRMLHGAAVASGGRVVAVVGQMGAGKSSVAAALMHDGASFVTDDVVTLSIKSGDVLVAPGPALMNVPSTQSADELGTQIAVFPDGERWVQMRGKVEALLPLAACVLLDRQEGNSPGVERTEASPLVLLAHSIHLDDSPGAAAQRFELMSDIAERVPVYRLVADTQETPELIARRLMSRLRADGVLTG